jgi:hypothetical protein
MVVYLHGTAPNLLTEILKMPLTVIENQSEKTSTIQSKNPEQETLSSDLWHEQISQGKAVVNKHFHSNEGENIQGGGGPAGFHRGESTKAKIDNNEKDSATSKGAKADACGANSKCWNGELPPLNSETLYATPSNDAAQTLLRATRGAANDAHDTTLNFPPMMPEQGSAVDDLLSRSNELSKMPLGEERMKRQTELWKETLPGGIHMKGE